MAMMGRADDLWQAVLVVNPIVADQIVPNARARQRNCYFSSSDAAFADRYQALRDYAKLRSGEVPVDGGWRIYSSGPGIYTNLVIRHLFGLRRCFDWIEIDPVMPLTLDGASCELTQAGRRVRYQFAIRGGVCSPRRISVNGTPLLPLTQVKNPHRPGGVRVLLKDFEKSLTGGLNHVEIEL
jgi:CRISPR-associated protein Csx3